MTCPSHQCDTLWHIDTDQNILISKGVYEQKINKNEQ